jgi:hypothetical protein
MFTSVCFSSNAVQSPLWIVAGGHEAGALTLGEFAFRQRHFWLRLERGPESLLPITLSGSCFLFIHHCCEKPHMHDVVVRPK